MLDFFSIKFGIVMIHRNESYCTVIYELSGILTNKKCASRIPKNTETCVVVSQELSAQSLKQ